MASPEDDRSNEKPTEYDGEVQSADNEGFDAAREHRLIKRIDFRLMPILCVLYALSLIDRGNLGSARVEGLGVTLKFEGHKNNHFSIALLVFFIGYFLFELPSTLVLRRLRPRNFLTIIIVLWGATTLGMGFVKSWKTLVVCRAFLGMLEAGFFPACVYLISSWYQRFEVQRRLSVFYMASSTYSTPFYKKTTFIPCFRQYWHLVLPPSWPMSLLECVVLAAFKVGAGSLSCMASSPSLPVLLAGF
ncbi:hypothetical protein FS749_013223 [Ceratobasidium sp. UAMH 11750]|nr:hypothetical protein FS749_013223 [Ceratobasidium sp. UAMH 11750]